MIRSMLAAGIVQDTFAGETVEGEGGEEEITGGKFIMDDMVTLLMFFCSYPTYKIISSYELARPLMGTIFLVSIIAAKYWSNSNNKKAIHTKKS